MRVTPRAVSRFDGKWFDSGPFGPARTGGHLFEQRHLQLERVDDLPVVPQRLGRVGLSNGVVSGMPPISSSSGVVKNTMLIGKPHDRVDERALLEDEVVEIEVLGGNGGGEAGRAGADNDDVTNGHISDDCTGLGLGLGAWGLGLGA